MLSIPGPVAQRILELDRAKVQAIEEQRFQDAARLRDRERELRQQARGRTVAEHVSASLLLPLRAARARREPR